MGAVTSEPKAANLCACHDWYPVSEIGTWIHTLHGRETVRERAADPAIWDEGNRELAHEELRLRIQEAGGIGCAHALDAITLLSGAVHLSNGQHRWTVAVELGLPAVPVAMIHEKEPTWAFPM